MNLVGRCVTRRASRSWAGRRILQGRLLTPGSLLLRGDVVAEGGHVGIYNPLPPNSPTVMGTISAAAGLGGRVVHNDWGFREGQNPVIRRCSCDLN